MMLGTPPLASPAPGILAEGYDHARQPRRKRKAEPQDHDRERLSKRLSLLNMEQNGFKLYVPVETPSVNSTAPANKNQTLSHVYEEGMQLDDAKHKVYIYNIDDELSSDSENEEGKLVFLPDIEKHLKENRIPQHVLANNDDELAGMQLVLYSDPKSLSVPEERDGVRKAIIEARQRTRENQRRARGGFVAAVESSGLQGSRKSLDGQTVVDDGCDAMEVD